MDTLAGRVAVVTGAASGIGRALSELLVLVCDDAEQLAEWGRHPADLAAGQQPVWPPA